MIVDLEEPGREPLLVEIRRQLVLEGVELIVRELQQLPYPFFVKPANLGSSVFTLSPPNIAGKDSERHYGSGRCSDSTATTSVWMGSWDSKQITASQDSTWLIAIYGTKALISKAPLGKIWCRCIS